MRGDNSPETQHGQTIPSRKRLSREFRETRSGCFLGERGERHEGNIVPSSYCLGHILRVAFDVSANLNMISCQRKAVIRIEQDLAGRQAHTKMFPSFGSICWNECLAQLFLLYCESFRIASEQDSRGTLESAQENRRRPTSMAPGRDKVSEIVTSSKYNARIEWNASFNTQFKIARLVETDSRQGILPWRDICQDADHPRKLGADLYRRMASLIHA
jgi:hypothetical protein